MDKKKREIILLLKIIIAIVIIKVRKIDINKLYRFFRAVILIITFAVIVLILLIK